MAPPDADQYEKYRREIESLKAEIGTLKYRMQTSESETEITLSQQNNRVEQARRETQEQAEKTQAAEAERSAAHEQLLAAKREVEDLKEAADAEKRSAERRARQATEEARLLQEQLEDVTNAKDEAARLSDKKIKDLQIQVSSTQSALQEMEQETQSRTSNLQQIQSQLSEKDSHISELEAEVLRLKAQSGDAETMEIIKRELSEQVSHIRMLEATNRDQLSELKHLRATSKAVEVVEEEKRSMQRRLEAAEILEAELSEARLQRQRLEDERLAWTSYLKTETGEQQFDSPEALARALTEERLTSASYMEQLGALRAELKSHQDHIRSLEDEKNTLSGQIEEAKASANASSADKARMRVERQRALAVKEVEYLRAQLKAVDDEDETMQPEQFDQTRANRVQELESIIDNYKTEVQNLHAEMTKKEDGLSASLLSPQPSAGSKRSREDDEAVHEQLGQLNRKNRKLQDELAGMQTKVALLEKDLSASREQLTAAKEHSKTRILSLRSNPTADYEAIKRATLEALQKENKELLATLRSKNNDPSISYIPTSVLGAMEREVADAKAETASAQKSMRRLKEVWGKKSNEFKEAIFSTLGWTVTFIPNGKMRVESTFYPSQTDEHENSIVFDGEKGTMKVGGGPRSAFAQRISDQIGFWVREKGCIPGFLAALTLEFYEEHAKTQS